MAVNPYLVDIPTLSYIEGYSPVLNKRQRCDSRALSNLLRFALAFYTEFGRPLVITEAARTRIRQDELWRDRFKLGIAVAVPYTSRHDEILCGNAFDLGSGIATKGTPAQKWAAANCEKYGVVWTGRYFNEAWHFEVPITNLQGSGTSIPIFIPAETEENELDATEKKQLSQALTEIGIVRTELHALFKNAQSKIDTLVASAQVVPTRHSGEQPVAVVLPDILTVVQNTSDVLNSIAAARNGDITKLLAEIEKLPKAIRAELKSAL